MLIDDTQRITDMVLSDPERLRILRIVAQFPGAYIGGGFIRNRVWDVLTGRETPLNDVDVVIYGQEGKPLAGEIEARLRELDPPVDWEVVDQATAHVDNGHPPYKNLVDALQHWPETATAFAMSLSLSRSWSTLLCPCGTQDLLNLVVRPTYYADMGIYADRVASKRWLTIWPELTVLPDRAPLPTRVRW